MDPPTTSAAATTRALGAGRSDCSRRHPKGLYYLAFTEAWERFSFYGMVALLSLYMVDQLLLPGHAEHVVGLTRFRVVLESLTGPLSPQAFASQIFGLYSGFVYFTPLLGGAIADRWLGQRHAVVLGALAMAAGHIAMTFDAAFLLALLLLVLGAGLLKGNIAAQVGTLYPPEDEARRARGYVIFSTGINIGAVAGPVLCGWLAQVYGWHYGFGIAAGFMLLGLGTYLCGYRHLREGAAPKRRAAGGLGRADWRVISLLIAVMLITVFPFVAFFEVFNVAPVWTEQNVEPDIAGFKIPVPWYAAVNSVFSILAVPPLLWIWRRQATRGREPRDLAKIGTGAWLTALSNLILVAAILGSSGARVSPVWPFLYSAGLGVAFMYYWPTLLALISQAAPKSVRATLVSSAYLTGFIANLLIGWIGGLWSKMTPAAFWALHAVIAAIGGMLVLVFGRRLTRALRAA